MWRAGFRLPEAPAARRAAGDLYAVRYSSELDVLLPNSNISDMSERAAWLDAQPAQSDPRWLIVTMHHPIYSSGPSRQSREARVNWVSGP